MEMTPALPTAGQILHRYFAANCRTNIAAIFQSTYGIFRGISKFLFIYISRCLAGPWLKNNYLTGHIVAATWKALQKREAAAVLQIRTH
jgi:hypothetical protein